MRLSKKKIEMAWLDIANTPAHSNQNARNLALVLPYFLITSIGIDIETISQTQRMKSDSADFHLWIWEHLFGTSTPRTHSKLGQGELLSLEAVWKITLQGYII